MTPHAQSPDDVARELGVDISKGVASDEIEKRRAQFGANVLVREAGRPPWRIFAHQFRSIIVLLLAIAAGVSFATRDAAEGFAILAVLAINAVIGFVIESQSESALRKLRLQTRATARVVRDGREVEVDGEDLVVGDVIILDPGMHTPADARLVEAASLQAEEAALTGESVPVEKSLVAVDADAKLPDRTSMVFLGTAITAGRGRAIVTAVGEKTELGRIGQLVRESHDEATPLERQLAALGNRLVYVVLVIAAIVVGVGVLRGEELWEMVEVGVSLAVAAVPEGLPAVTTLILALGVLRMAKRHAIVRRLPAVETLGSTTVICTDKTGTLTMNRLTVRAIEAEERERLLRDAVLCNDATESSGDPTEVALILAARDAGLDIDAIRRDYSRIDEEAFSSETKRMVTRHRTPDGKELEIAKGAPKVILDLTENVDRDAVLARNEALASQALRVLAFAENRKFLGLVGMDDPPRPDAADAIADAHTLGVRVVMLTGDQIHTARAIASELGVDEVHARVSPADKLEIVDRLRSSGEIVAVTGDGVNDAPALRRADIGIAMGRSGTEVAKQSADLVLIDDRLATIVDAIEQGRTIYANIRKFVHLMFSNNLAEILVVFIAIAAGMPLPLLPLQILWINIVTDIFPAFGLALEPPSSRERMKRPSRVGALLRRDFIGLVAWQGAMLGAITLAAYAWALGRHGGGPHARTIALFALISVQIGQTLNCRSRTASAFAGLHRNPHVPLALMTVVALQLLAYHVDSLARLLGVARLDGTDLGILVLCAIVPVVIVESWKAVIRSRR